MRTRPDYLNTPRLVADATGTTVWKWDQAEPFGDSPVDENPSGAGTFDLPLRLPGQYYDAESGQHYNYFRDYAPSTGRYLEPDPIGAIVDVTRQIRTTTRPNSIYGYVEQRPLTLLDPFGLYGTTNCSYYVKQCQKNGGVYYCFFAQVACNYIPPLIRSNWTECVRQCLQEADARTCAPCKGKGSDVWCTTGAHVFCWYKCAVDPNNPPRP